MRSETFSIRIAADRARVWDRMLAPDTYRAWTAAFQPGSTYAGAWRTGAAIRFLGPGGDGMTAVVEEATRPERLTIRHIGVLRKGVEITSGPEIEAWAPAYERYELIDEAGGTRLDVRTDLPDAYADMLLRAWPDALRRLKDVCEHG